MPPPLAARLQPGARWLCLLAALACLAVLAIGYRLTPDPRGVGTHQSLGLPPCGWLAASGWPCPTCGMTTSVSLAANGRFIDSARVQPAGTLFALALALAFWPLALSAATGSRAAVLLSKLASPVVIWTLLAVVLIAWAYKSAVMRGWTTA